VKSSQPGAARMRCALRWTSTSSLRLGRRFRCRWCAWRDRRGASDQHAHGVSAPTAVDCSRSHDQESEGERTASLRV